MKVETAVPFVGTKEQEAELKEVIARHKDQKGALMPILQGAQHIYGYMPHEVQLMIAQGLGISESEVYGVVTFYSQFSLTPKGKYRVAICMGTACYVKGAGKILEEFEKQIGCKAGDCTHDMKFSIDATRCIGACGLAPVLSVNEDIYGKVTEDMVEDILSNYK
jgi:NADH-quinone oxidoreductase subunit E/NADP-reducing hydrogenase subunit HndA